MKARTWYDAELEAQRLHVSENSHPESKTAIVAQVKADKDLNEVLKNFGKRRIKFCGFVVCCVAVDVWIYERAHSYIFFLESK